MKSILSDLPTGSEVVMRTIHDRVVEIVYGGDDLLFSAVAPGRSRHDDDCEFYGRASVADFDLPLVKCGAKFWLVIETVRRRDGHTERTSAIAFQHPGVETAAEALTKGAPGGDAA
jgi:hypothetical protein